ncbi:MAG: hypothetical protein MJY97_00120 [Bacteroidales bacterium]|nr:hypothetical protein [Bacteroidales bacterium]
MSKRELFWTLSLMLKQRKMLKHKDNAISELYNSCKNDSQRQLVSDLLSNFLYLDFDRYAKSLNSIASHIKSLKLPVETTAIVAFCHDSNADSSQQLLQELKVVVSIALGTSLTTINRFDKIPKYYNQGIRHFIAVDEFCGSGQTVINRFEDFGRMKLGNATIYFCLLASMKEAQSSVTKSGCDFFAANILSKGITDFYPNQDLSLMCDAMKDLESRLEPVINQTVLADYSFGYGQTESLYYKSLGNIPNNVFPIFWWKENIGKEKRDSLFIRVQDGY